MNIYKVNYNLELAKTHTPCDFDFIEYLNQNNIINKSIFHYGTGGHHIIGKKIKKNDIFGLTLNKDEYIDYINLISIDPKINRSYKVIFSDIYNLNNKSIPKFDYINLFHLCTYYDKEKNSYSIQNDETLLDLMIKKLNPNGFIVFYTRDRSYKRKKTQKIINNFKDKIKLDFQFKSLIFYKKILN